MLTSAGDLRVRLEQLEERLRGLGHPVVEILGPPLDPDHVREALLEQFGVAPEELVTWFSWHNGVVPVRRGEQRTKMHEILVLLDLLPFDGALSDSAVRRQRYPVHWDPQLLPLLTNGSDTEILARCDSRDTVPLSRYRYSEGPPEDPFASSLGEMIEAWHDFLDLGYRWDPEKNKSWVDDSKITKDLARRLGFPFPEGAP